MNSSTHSNTALKLLLLAVFLQTGLAQGQEEAPTPNFQAVEDFQTVQTSDDEAYVNHPTSSYWENLHIDPSIYDTPYKVSLFNPQNGEDQSRLWSQTKSIFAYTAGAASISAMLPDDQSKRNILDQWMGHVSQVAVWDRDRWYINAFGHPYFGGVYYQAARKSGYRQWDSFFYSFMMSTFYWEYGVEAFAEVPSIQDLVITPVMGWVYGEWAFHKEQEIRNHGGVVYGSKLLGSTTLFMLDPVDSLGSWINKKVGSQLITAGTGSIFYGEVPLGNQPNAPREKQFKVNVQYALGQSSKPAYYKQYQATSNDPVDTGVVGISLGMGHITLDDTWGFESGVMPEWTMGLYLSPALSMRLKYGKLRLEELLSSEKTTYENYSLSAQYYFNSTSKTRPYISTGIGEEIFDKDRQRKNVFWTLALGVHHKINDNWSVQADWENFYSTSKKTYENSINARIVYRFGNGERARERTK